MPVNPVEIINRLEALKKVSSHGVEYWHAREIFPILGYSRWEGFAETIGRAQDSCRSSGRDPQLYFREVPKVDESKRGPKGRDYQLARYACYLIAMNGDTRKVEIGAAQSYFAYQTRRMEIEDQNALDSKRVELRDKATEVFKKLSSTAQSAGVRNHMQPVFHDAGYRGMYEQSRKEVLKRKGLAEKDNLLDYAGTLELAAHNFRMELADDVIRRENIQGEQPAINRGLQRNVDII